MLIYDNPELIEYLSKRLLEQNIERIRMLAAAGGDAIYIDDAMSTSDMVSPDTYEKYSLPYLKEQVKEIHRLRKKAIVIYFGGVADRVEQIVSAGADAMIMEASMKGFVNDYEIISQKIGGRMCLYTNLNPYEDIQIPDDEQLKNNIVKIAKKAKAYGKYIISTGSPVIPNTSLSRLQTFIQIARNA